MKHTKTLFVVFTSALLILSGCKKEVKVPVESVTLSEIAYTFRELGETLQLKATVHPEDATNQEVTWKSSDVEAATVSENGLVTSVGYGVAQITATADGKSASCEVSFSDGTILDMCGNRYKPVKIGDQVWLSENMRCNKYDTDSEMRDAKIDVFSYKEPMEETFAPYCVDASEKGNWSSESCSENLLPEHISKLGYLYNWAAAVGLKDESAAKEHSTAFKDKRQGICPNGWHVPTLEEWEALKGVVRNGKHLMTTSGWHLDGDGTDRYLFAALPAGRAEGSVIGNVGASVSFWTDAPSDNDDEFAYTYCDLNFNSPSLSKYRSIKTDAHPVRCIKNKSE